MGECFLAKSILPLMIQGSEKIVITMAMVDAHDEC